MASTYEALLLAQFSMQGRGIVATPTTTTSNGTVTSGTTDTMDAVLGTYQFVAIAGRRYVAQLNNMLCSCTAASDLYIIRIRDSGSSSTPTTASTAVALSQWECQTIGGPGQTSGIVDGSFKAGTSGLHTLGVFIQRSAGSGALTPVSGSLARELFVTDIGVF